MLMEKLHQAVTLTLPLVYIMTVSLTELSLESAWGDSYHSWIHSAWRRWIFAWARPHSDISLYFCK